MSDPDFRALELELMKPGVRASAESLEELLSADFREFGGSGRSYSRDEMIAALVRAPALSGDPSAAPVLEDFRVLRLGDVALVTYRAGRSLRSSLWRREGERYRMVFHQGTPSVESRSTGLPDEP